MKCLNCLKFLSFDKSFGSLAGFFSKILTSAMHRLKVPRDTLIILSFHEDMFARLIRSIENIYYWYITTVCSIWNYIHLVVLNLLQDRAFQTPIVKQLTKFNNQLKVFVPFLILVEKKKRKLIHYFFFENKWDIILKAN